MASRKTTKELARELGLLRKRRLSTLQKNTNLKKVCQNFSYLIVLDFESTCWKDDKHRPQEIIEFPAVLLNTRSGEIEEEFHHYVQPQESPRLSAFCTELTGISQDQVENGIPLINCLTRFCHWLKRLVQEKGLVYNDTQAIGLRPCTFVTWSDWDLSVCLFYECKRKQIRRPAELDAWMDLRATYRKFYARKPQGLNGALKDVGIQFEGRQHSGLHDSRNTARLVWKMICDGCMLSITKTLPGSKIKAGVISGPTLHIPSLHMPVMNPPRTSTAAASAPRSSASSISTPRSSMPALSVPRSSVPFSSGARSSPAISTFMSSMPACPAISVSKSSALAPLSYAPSHSAPRSFVPALGPRSSSAISTARSSVPAMSAPKSSAATISATRSFTPAVSVLRSFEPTISAQRSSLPCISGPRLSSPTISTLRPFAIPVPRPSAPATSTSRSSAHVISAPRPSAPVMSVPRSSAPAMSIPRSSAPVMSGPRPSAPVMSAPRSSAPVMSAPRSYAPAISAPRSPAPVMSAPRPSAPAPRSFAATLSAPRLSATTMSNIRSFARAMSAPQTSASVISDCRPFIASSLSRESISCQRSIAPPIKINSTSRMSTADRASHISASMRTSLPGNNCSVSPITTSTGLSGPAVTATVRYDTRSDMRTAVVQNGCNVHQEAGSMKQYEPLKTSFRSNQMNSHCVNQPSSLETSSKLTMVNSVSPAMSSGVNSNQSRLYSNGRKFHPPNTNENIAKENYRSSNQNHTMFKVPTPPTGLRMRSVNTTLFSNLNSSSDSSSSCGDSPVFRTPSPLSTSGSSRPGSHMKATPPMCQCGRRATRKLVQSPGPNMGRSFFCCPKARQGLKCGFFKWESPVSNSPYHQITPILNMKARPKGTFISPPPQPNFNTPQSAKK